MKTLISVIIPVYNAGTKINLCMRSLLAQTYSNIEIILVDDKSPDTKTIQILREWVQKDSRVRLLEKEVNGGSSRLDGIKIAQGDYIVLVDQDDWMHKNAIEQMYNAAIKNDADVVIGQIAKAIKIGSVVHSFSPKRLLPHTGEVLVHEELMGEYFESYFGHNILPVTVWGKLYKRSLFDKVTFPSPWPNTGAADLYMSMLLHPYIQRLIIIPDIVYSYFVGLPGASPKYLNGWLERACVLFACKWEMLEKYNFSRGFYFQAVEMVNYMKTFVRNCTIFDIENKESRIRELAKSLEDPVWQRIHLLKDTEYKEQILVGYILEKKTRDLYEELEKRYLPTSIKGKIINRLLQFSAKFK